jgi:dipeptidyl-peptidase 4
MVTAVSAQRSYTADDYSHAEKFMGYNTNPMVYHAVRPAWLEDDRVWFRDAGPAGPEFVIVDAASGKREPAFDHAKLAAALTTAAQAF